MEFESAARGEETRGVAAFVLLVGSADDPHVEALADALAARGAPCEVLDLKRFPASTRLTLGHQLDAIRADGRELGRPAAVYLRQLYSSPVAFDVQANEAMEEDWYTTMVTFREKSEVVFSLLGLNFLLNSWHAYGG